MTSTPVVSVITPSYNYAQYLPLTLASVEDATRSTSLEHVVVDDGSTDSSWSLLEAAAAHRGDLVISRHANRGLSATLNAAMELARGEWLVWLNADDLHLPWTYRLFTKALGECATADIVFGDALFIDGENRLLRLVSQPQFDRRILMGGYNMFHNCSVFWRRALLPPGWKFDEEMRLFMDLDLWLTITSTARAIVKIDAALSAFRRHEKQTSASHRDSDLAEMHRLAARHGLHSLLRLSAARATWPSRIRHAAGKRLDGGIRRERALRPAVGRDMASLAATGLDALDARLRCVSPNRGPGQSRGVRPCG